MAECSNDNLINGSEESNLPSIPVSTLFNSYDLARYNRLIDFIVGEIFRKYVGQKGFTVSDLKNPDNVALVYNGVKDYLSNMLIDKSSDSAQDSIWKKLSDKAVIDIDTIIENFDSFMDNYSKYNNIVNTSEFNFLDESGNEDELASTDEKEEESEDDNEKEENKGKDYDRIGNEQSQLELASKSVKVLFRLIPKAEYNPVTEKSELILDNDGLPTVANFSATWNLLADRLAGEKDYDKLKEILASKQLQLIVPEVQFINEILKIDKVDKTLSEVQQFLSFYQAFSKPKVPIKSSYRGSDGSFTLNDEILGNTLKIQAEFNKNFVEGNIPEDWKKYTKKSESGVFYLQKNDKGDYIPPRPETFEDKLKFLNFIGVRFSRVQFLSVLELEEYRSIVDETSIVLYNSLKNRLESGSITEKGVMIYNTINEPIKQLKKRYGSINSEIKSIEKIIQFESKFSRLTPSHSSRTATGELQHLIMNDSGLSITTYYLNSSTTLEQLYRTPAFINAKYNPQFRASNTINFLFDSDGNKIQGRMINLELLSGDKVQTDKTKSRLERSLSKPEKLLQDYSMFLQYARTDTMRTELSNSFYMLGLTQNGRPQQYFNPKGFATSFFGSRQFKKQTLAYLNGELTRIKSFAKVKAENPSIPDTYGDFSIFSEVFTNGKNDNLKINLLAEKENIVDDSPLFTIFTNEYEKVLNDELENFKKLLTKNNVTNEALLSKQLKALGQNIDSLHRAFIAGTLVQNIEFSILYTGDTLFYKDMHKRIKGLSSTGSIAANLPLLAEYYNSDESKSFDDKYSLFRALGKRRRDNTHNFLTQTLKEYPIRQGNAYLSKNLNTPSDSLIQNIIDSIMLRDKTLGRYDSDYLSTLLSKANEQKPADGQGYINPDFHRELSLRFGFSTAETEVAYKYEGLMFRRDILEKTLTNNEQAELDRYEEIIYTNPDKYALPVIKMTYWGNIENTTVDAKAYDKFSVAPILSSHAKNHPEMKAMLLDMVRGDYGYVKYESGTKLFKRSIASSLVGAEPDLYSTQLLKEQIKTNNEQKKDTSIPTQELKLIFTNLFNEGKARTPAVEVLYNKYINSLSAIQKEQVNRTLGDLGISYTERDGRVSITSVNMIKLSERLIREAKRQQLNSNIISALNVNDKGELRMLPESTGFQKQINDLIGGILDRNLRRFKFPGGDFVLMSNAGHGPLRWYKFSMEGTEACECRVTLAKEYSKLLRRTHPDGKKIGTIDRLNKLIRNKEWKEENKKALTLIYARPPIDGPHSMGHAIVAEFLPPTMGNVLILPDEATFKGGIDFDYDKVKVITPVFDGNGNYMTVSPEERLEQIIKKLNELQDIYPELQRLASIEETDTESYDKAVDDTRSNFINKIFNTSSRKELFKLNAEASALLDEYFSLKNEISVLKNNSIVETYSEIFSLPEMFAELILPTSADNVRRVADNNEENTGAQASLPQGARALYYTENLNVFKTFFDANGLLGAFATDNTFQQLMTYSGINVNEKYSTKKFDFWVPENINVLALSTDERAKVYKNGKILTSLRDDIEGFIKQHWNAENISATVDAAKDPFFAKLRIVWENIGVANLLKNFGVPFERVVDFLNNSLLQHYFSLKQSGMRAAEALQSVARNRLAMKSYANSTRVVPKDKYSSYVYDTTEQLIEKKLLLPGQTVAVDEFGKRKTKKKEGVYSVEVQTINYPDYYSILDMMREVDNGQPITKKGYDYVNKWINSEPITPERLKFLANPKNDRQIVRQDASRAQENIPIYSDDIRILANFLQLEKVNYAFRDFHKYFNFDTFKVTTTLDVRIKEKLRRKIISQGLFSEDDISKMENNSILSPFINGKAIRDIYNKMFPILGMPIVQNYLAELYEAYDSPARFSIKNKKDLRNLPKILSQDFTASIVFSLGQMNGVNIFDRGKDLVIRNGKKPTMVDRLVKFRKQTFYTEISKKFPVLDRFISNNMLMTDAYDLNGLQAPLFIESIQFIKNPNETLLEQEEVIEQLRDMYYTYKYDSSNKETNDKVNTALHTFLEDLFVTGIVQSGFSKNYFSFQEYIPLSFKEDIFSKATADFQKLSTEQVKDFMGAFYYSFMNNNPRYFPWYKYKTGDNKTEKVTNGNRYSDRIKFYKIPILPSEPTTPRNTPPVTPPVVPSSKIEQKDITEITRATKKENYQVTLQDGSTEERTGYRIHIKEYPDFQGFITGSSKEGWNIDELTTSKTIPVRSDTIKEILPELMTTLNRVYRTGDRNLLKLIGLFNEDETEKDENQEVIQLDNEQEARVRCK